MHFKLKLGLFHCHLSLSEGRWFLTHATSNMNNTKNQIESHPFDFLKDRYPSRKIVALMVPIAFPTIGLVRVFFPDLRTCWSDPFRGFGEPHGNSAVPRCSDQDEFVPFKELFPAPSIPFQSYPKRVPARSVGSGLGTPLGVKTVARRNT